MGTRLDKTIAVGLLLAVALAALMFGTVEPWSLAVFELLITALLLLWAVKCVAERRLKLAVPNTALPLLALFAVGVAQSVAFADGQGRTRSLSADVEATRAAVVVLFFLIASFFIAANFFDSRGRVRTLSVFLTLFGVALAVFSLIQHLSWDGHFYWLRPTKQLAVFGPFANRNHYAGFMEMLIPLPIAFIVARGVRKEARLFYGFAAAMMGVSLVTSQSRGGVISLAAGLIFMVAVSRRLRKRTGRTADGAEPDSESFDTRGRAFLPKLTKRVGAVAAICFAILIGVIWLGAEGVLNRFVETLDERSDHPSQFYSRDWIWKDSLSLIRANPVSGVGLGAFQTAFPRFSHGDGKMVVEYSHNDYLQVLTDGGAIGGVIALWFIVLLFRATARSLRSPDAVLRSFALAGGAGAFSIFVHSLFDFNLQIPSNVLLFLIISAVVSRVAAGVDRDGSQGVTARAVEAGALASGAGVLK